MKYSKLVKGRILLAVAVVVVVVVVGLVLFFTVGQSKENLRGMRRLPRRRGMRRLPRRGGSDGRPRESDTFWADNAYQLPFPSLQESQDAYQKVLDASIPRKKFLQIRRKLFRKLNEKKKLKDQLKKLNGENGENGEKGCPNNCSNKGECLGDGTCKCAAHRSGDDCSVVNCVKGPSGKICSGRGTCREDGTCDCDGGYTGADCATDVFSTDKISRSWINWA
jgi:hypothetical protein